ncbi:hypothetical protein [Paraflavitalea pollutisoli]|uniref:hypothetical protein n=1 Tax=Paraflavitalea pollutisoli TaxID=3034143 RepID=UPI0023EB8A0A|nr:hypothetical protein [Paraflavitalea sp. H1-2-19X]
MGDKIKIDRILNRPIVVESFRIEPSKFEGKGNRLTLQIKIDNNSHIVFTGSQVLMDMIAKVPADGFPFETKIVKQDDSSLQFT